MCGQLGSTGSDACLSQCESHCASCFTGLVIRSFILQQEIAFFPGKGKHFSRTTTAIQCVHLVLYQQLTQLLLVLLIQLQNRVQSFLHQLIIMENVSQKYADTRKKRKAIFCCTQQQHMMFTARWREEEFRRRGGNPIPSLLLSPCHKASRTSFSPFWLSLSFRLVLHITLGCTITHSDHHLLFLITRRRRPLALLCYDVWVDYDHQLPPDTTLLLLLTLCVCTVCRTAAGR